MTWLSAHVICVALVGIDLLARSLRLRWLLRSLGHPLVLRAALVVNAAGDAACALTPLRSGGEPVRLAVMLRQRVTAAAAIAAIGLELLVSWPVIVGSAALLAGCFAPAWWRQAAPGLAVTARGMWPGLVAVLAASGVAWVIARRIRRGAGPSPARARALRAVSPRLVAACLPLSLLSLAARTAVLPVLASTLTVPPPLGPSLLGSFALLYSQLVLPTPSGLGAVDLGFLAGAAGALGAQGAALLLAWRWYTSGIGILLGAVVAARELAAKCDRTVTPVSPA